jgi:hypothetical protein
MGINGRPSGNPKHGSLGGALAAVFLLGTVAVVSLSACKTPRTFDGGQASESMAVHLKKITYVAEQHGTVVKVFTSRKPEFTSYKLAEPLRLAVEIPNVVLDFEPKRISVEDEIISAINVVRFSKVNSVRLELELLSDAQFKIAYKRDYIEVLLPTPGGSITSSAATLAARKETASAPGSAETGKAQELKDRIDALTAETIRLKEENLATRKNAVKMEEENNELKRQLEESHRQIEEVSSLSKTMQARVAFVEQQLNDLEEKINSIRNPAPAPSGPTLNVAAVPTPLPAPVPLANTGSAEPAKTGNRTLEVNLTVAAWLKTWNKKDLDGYSSFYAPEFRSKDMGRKEWMEDKAAKFSSGGEMKIAAKDVKITINPDATATVVFVQKYRAGSYRDTGMKQLILANQQGKWQITSEEWSRLR